MTRIGYRDSILEEGDPIPLKFGKYYEYGQYAPEESSLSFLRLLESKELGLFNDMHLDIYNDDGSLSENKVKLLDINSLIISDLNIPNIENNIPKFAAINFYSVVKKFEHFVKAHSISSLVWINFVDMLSLPNRKAFVTGLYNDNNKYKYVIYQPYYIYITVPYVNKIPTIQEGISVASVATAKTFAKSVFFNLLNKFPEKLYAFIKEVGWEKEQNIEENSKDYIKAGKKFNLPVNNKWYHSIYTPIISVNSCISPEEYFTDVLFYFYFHRAFLKSYSIELYNLLEDLEDFVKKL